MMPKVCFCPEGPLKKTTPPQAGIVSLFLQPLEAVVQRPPFRETSTIPIASPVTSLCAFICPPLSRARHQAWCRKTPNTFLKEGQRTGNIPLCFLRVQRLGDICPWEKRPGAARAVSVSFGGGKLRVHLLLRGRLSLLVPVFLRLF